MMVEKFVSRLPTYHVLFPVGAFASQRSINNRPHILFFGSPIQRRFADRPLCRIATVVREGIKGSHDSS